MSCNPCKDINECQEQQGLCGDHGRCVNLVSTLKYRINLQTELACRLADSGFFKTVCIKVA